MADINWSHVETLLDKYAFGETSYEPTKEETALLEAAIKADLGRYRVLHKQLQKTWWSRITGSEPADV